MIIDAGKNSGIIRLVAMGPNVFLYDETEHGPLLYLAPYTTLEGLYLFDNKLKLFIEDFGAKKYKNYEWATEKEIPSIASVGAMVDFLNANGDIGIVDFRVRLLKFGYLSTHDDNECNILFEAIPQCMDTLKKVLPSQFGDILLDNLMSNKGMYIACNRNGTINKYASFDEYVSSNSV